jgi:ferredoxin-NADP reductase
MAVPRFARLARATELAADVRVLELEMTEPLGFLGGQYVIVDSGLVLPTGKACKRAYSILTPDGVQDRFTLASKRIPGGLGSGYVHEAAIGAELKFSGPWGKMFPATDATGKTLVLATDTGITAALGLVRGARFAPLLSQTTFFWLRTSGEYFLPDALVRSLLPLGGTIAELPPINHPERVPWVRGLVRELIPGLSQAFIAGDGAVNYALLADLVAAGVPASRDSVESFFNMPPKTAA